MRLKVQVHQHSQDFIQDQKKKEKGESNSGS